MTWIVTPRTRFFDDFAYQSYAAGTRQFVLVGAGMDARSWRMGMTEASFFEVDKPALFYVKEPLMEEVPLQCANRQPVPVDLSVRGASLEDALLGSGFDPSKPSCWLMEGLMMYLTHDQAVTLLRAISRLAAVGSSVVHDAISASYVSAGVEVCGARFLGGNDDYGGFWAEQGGFDRSDIIDFQDIGVDRHKRGLRMNPRRPAYRPEFAYGHRLVLFVQAWKTV